MRSEPFWSGLRRAVFLSWVLLFLPVTSCLPGLPEEAPFLISSIAVVNGAEEGQYIGRLEFSLLNRSEKDISGLELRFAVVDTEGKPRPSAGTNIVETAVALAVPPGNLLPLSILLDPLFSCRPGKSLTADNFLILAVDFADGSRWEDSAGYYLVGCEDIEVLAAEDSEL